MPWSNEEYLTLANFGFAITTGIVVIVVDFKPEQNKQSVFVYGNQLRKLIFELVIPSSSRNSCKRKDFVASPMCV